MQFTQKKICILGDFAVGKTSLIRRFVEGRFDDRYLSTVGVKISRKLLNWGDRQLTLIIWDLAGGEDFSSHDKNYLRGASGAVLVYDLTRPETLGTLSGYARQMNETNPGATLVVAANKFDLLDKQPAQFPDLEVFCREIHSQFLYTSAKTGENVEEIINLLAHSLIPEE